MFPYIFFYRRDAETQSDEPVFLPANNAKGRESKKVPYIRVFSRYSRANLFSAKTALDQTVRLLGRQEDRVVVRLAKFSHIDGDTMDIR